MLAAARAERDFSIDCISEFHLLRPVQIVRVSDLAVTKLSKSSPAPAVQFRVHLAINHRVADRQRMRITSRNVSDMLDFDTLGGGFGLRVEISAVSYTHLTLPTT